MNVSLYMVHLRRDALHASVCRSRAVHFPSRSMRVFWLGCAILCGDRVGKGALRVVFGLSYDIEHAVAKKS